MADGATGDPVIAALSAGAPTNSAPTQARPTSDPVISALSASPQAAIRSAQPSAESNPALGEGNDPFVEGFGKSFYDTGRGVRQIALHIGNHLGLVSDEDVANYDQQVARARALDRPLMETTGGKIGDVMGGVAQAAVVGPESIPASAAAGAGIAGLQPVVGDESRISNMEEGALGGAAGAAAGKVAGAALRGFGGPGARQGAVDILQNEGIPLSTAQQTGSKVAQHIERASAITGDDAAQFAAQQGAAFNRAVLRRVGVTDPEVTAATPDVLSAAKSNIVQVMDEVGARTKVKLDQPFQADLGNIRGQIERTLPQSEAAPLLRNLEDIGANASANGGTLNGAFVQKLRSNLSALERNPGTAPLAGDLKDAVDDAMVRSAQPGDVPALQQARRQYRALKQIEPAINPATGDISPLALMRSLSVKSNRNQALYGQGDQSLMNLARAAKQVIPDLLGNSGTAERLLPGVGAIETLASGQPLQAGAKLLAGKAGLNAAGRALRSQGTVGRAVTGGVPGGSTLGDLIRRAAGKLGYGALGMPESASAREDQAP